MSPTKTLWQICPTREGKSPSLQMYTQCGRGFICGFLPFLYHRSLQSRKEMYQTCRYHPGVTGIPLTGITHLQQVYTSTRIFSLPLAVFHMIYRYTLYAVNHAYKSLIFITQWYTKYISLSIKSSLSVIIPQGTIDNESAGTDFIISFYCKMMMFIDITIRQTLKWSRC